MKAPYEELEMEVIRFRTEDIITTSDAANDNNDQDVQDGGSNNGGTNQTSGANNGSTNQAGGGNNSSATENSGVNNVPDGYTATGDTINIGGKEYPEYRKDGESGGYYFDGTNMIGPFV